MNTDDLDDMTYVRFCNKQNLNKSLNILKGILSAITFDGNVSSSEVKELKEWCNEHACYRRLNPFDELLPVVESALSDGMLEAEELKDIDWFLEKALNDNEFYDNITNELQQLHGILHGILADRVVNEDEVKLLSEWMDEREYLAGCYPFDEIYSIVLDVLKDGFVDEDEAKLLRMFFSEFVTLSTNNQIELNRCIGKKATALGVCSADPLIEFKAKRFCFTGASIRASRKEYQKIISSAGGVFGKNITKDTDYLVYGAAGNQCWAYSCHGRKVEQAVLLRKGGHNIIIVHENDFWDVFEDISLD